MSNVKQEVPSSAAYTCFEGDIATISMLHYRSREENTIHMVQGSGEGLVPYMLVFKNKNYLEPTILVFFTNDDFFTKFEEHLGNPNNILRVSNNTLLVSYPIGVEKTEDSMVIHDTSCIIRTMFVSDLKDISYKAMTGEEIEEYLAMIQDDMPAMSGEETI